MWWEHANQEIHTYSIEGSSVHPQNMILLMSG